MSQYGAFMVKLQSERAMHLMDGRTQILDEGIVAEFATRGQTQRDVEVAMDTFQFRGLYQMEDEATPVHPIHRISVYDTDEQAERYGWEHEWDEEKLARHDGLNKKAWIERELQAAHSYGRAFVLVPEVEIAPPWPGYVRFEGDATELVLTAINLEYPLEEVLEFEASKWGPQRAEVIDALNTAIEARDAEEIVLG